eukprot:1652213-Pyramimonas_sp.AAC.1
MSVLCCFHPVPRASPLGILVHVRLRAPEDPGVQGPVVHAVAPPAVPGKVTVQVHAASISRMQGFLHGCAPVRDAELLLPILYPRLGRLPQLQGRDEGQAVEGEHEGSAFQPKRFARLRRALCVSRDPPAPVGAVVGVLVRSRIW